MKELTPQEQLDADVKLLLGPRSCSPQFVKRFNEANDRVARAYPGGAWTVGDHWDGSPFSQR
jgi:hypothetical protein